MTTKEKLNKGEWGEAYVALQLLGSGRLSMANEEKKEIVDHQMEVLSLVRQETEDRLVVYNRDPEKGLIEISVNNGSLVKYRPIEDFSKAATTLFSAIKGGSGRTFCVPDTLSSFFKEVEIRHFKAKSIEKSDLLLTARDPRAGVVRDKIGFSIKSQYSGDSTLFNTGPASATVYSLINMNDELMNEVNSMKDAKGNVDVAGRCKRLIESDCHWFFLGYPVASRAGIETFRENLDLLNPRLPEVIRAIQWNYFIEGFRPHDISQTVERIVEENPCDLLRPDVKYPFMIKNFLYGTYCGLTAGTLWDGSSNVNGGFLTVGQSGDILAFYALESEVFKAYLYDHSYVDHPATSSGHGFYANVYKEGKDYFFRLNFQIRLHS